MIVHDHFDGLAHCIECGGTCCLAGDDLKVTRLVRYVFEFVHTTQRGWMWDLLELAMADVIGAERVAKFRERAGNIGGGVNAG